MTYTGSLMFTTSTTCTLKPAIRNRLDTGITVNQLQNISCSCFENIGKISSEYIWNFKEHRGYLFPAHRVDSVNAAS